MASGEKKRNTSEKKCVWGCRLEWARKVSLKSDFWINLEYKFPLTSLALSVKMRMSAWVQTVGRSGRNETREIREWGSNNRSSRDIVRTLAFTLSKIKKTIISRFQAKSDTMWYVYSPCWEFFLLWVYETMLLYS